MTGLLRRVGSIVLCLIVIAAVFLPWVDAGVAIGTETVLGFDIPVLGWSALIAAIVLLGLSVAGALHASRWWWVGSSFVSGVMITSAALTLATIDVVDSAAVKWIVEVLPEQVQESSPKIAASFGLWVMLGALTLYSVLAAYVTVRLGARASQKSSSARASSCSRNSSSV